MADTAPPGLDAYVDSLQGPATPDAAVSPTGPPEGLDDYVSGLQQQALHDQYSTPGQLAKTAVEGVGHGVAGPAFTALETGLLGNADEQRMRAEQHPVLSGASEAVGFVAPALISGGASLGARAGISGAAKAASIASKAAEFSQAGLLEKVGLKAAASLGLSASKEAKILSKIGAKTINEATQMAMLQAGDEASKMIQKDPEQTADSALAHVGLAAGLGGVFGLGTSSAGQLWKATAGPKAVKFAADFTGRLAHHVDQPGALKAVSGEMEGLYSSVKNLEKGVGDEAVAAGRASAKPEMSFEDLERHGAKREAAQESLRPHLEEFDKHFTSPVVAEASAVERQYLDPFTKKPIDPAKVAEMGLDKAAAPVASAERVIDPAKVAEFIENPTPKAKEALSNFIKESETFRKSMGIEGSPGSLSALHDAAGKLSPGARVADALVTHALGKLSGEAIGAGIGASIGSAMGHAGIGAYAGEKILSKTINSVLPSLIGPLKKAIGNAGAVKAALDYAAAAAQGYHSIARGAKSVFQEGGAKVIQMPKASDRMKLDKVVQNAQNDPMKFAELGKDLGHSMPEQATALGTATARALSYLSSIRPGDPKRAPLDTGRTVDPFKSAKYMNALDLANDPTLVFHKIQAGRLTVNDVKAIQAMYPGFYRLANDQIGHQLIESAHRGDIVPYGRRVALSMFMAQPLDSTLTPKSILAMQPLPDAPPPGGAEAKGLSEMSDQARTPAQARGAAKQSAKN